MKRHSSFLILILALSIFVSKKSLFASQKNPSLIKDSTKVTPITKDSISNIATIIPVTQNREASVYNWNDRHQEVLALNKERPPKIVFIGNSILHYWGGEPKAPFSRGADSWNLYFKSKDIRNLGFGWDRIENVLWRVNNGELDGYTASHIVLLIGTNNLSINTDDEIIKGLDFLLKTIKAHQPKAEIILMGLLPRKSYESRISVLNSKISKVADMLKVSYINSGNLLLGTNDKINETLFSDGVHPNTEGYRLLAPLINSYLIK